ncbi:DNA repair protein rad2 [Neofusicoccum ribis]|uniref:DNA repair protein rad2 n=1 Tax=Neofusicoccum ribis TaxID=45134 RepID=A0ABR3SMT5_9PEZI
MGVTGLWTVVQPCARPIKIETLNKKRLAVDASIWIYQFLKAVRDKEGNALRNSHVVGFFRRICKLLFIGIKPVFVFDGGAPALKRQTISARKSRREGRREDAVRTASKLLAVQMQRRAEEEERKRKDAATHRHTDEPEEEPLPANLVYAEEVTMTERERQQARRFKKKDAYHLPELDVSLSEMGAPNDPRIMSLEELEAYARQFERGEDINVYDFSKIDFDSPFFLSLPATDRYNILNAARLRSRLRMGYSKDQLDSMFQDRMAFSKFQIERVTERNELTQRLMNINNGDTLYGMDAGGRVAGEKNREYVLVKNDGVEGGWALGVVDKDEGRFDKPIDVDRSSPPKEEEDDDWDDEEDFEDVPIEGLNRLPKQKPAPNDEMATDLARRRQELYRSRQAGAQRRRGPPKPRNIVPDSLFVEAEVEDDEWENVDMRSDDGLFEEQEQGAEDGDEELQRAIAMSLQQDRDETQQPQEQKDDVDEDDDFLEVFQRRAEESRPFTKGSGLAIARTANNRSARIAKPAAESDSEGDEVDLQAALAESRKSKYKPIRPEQPRKPVAPAKSTPSNQPAAGSSSNPSGFGGPLPFEKLDLGSSLLGKKKMQKLQEDQSGGFERPEDAEKKKAAPLPPWFAENRDVREDVAEQKRMEAEQRERDRKALETEFEFQEPPRLRQQGTTEVIDLDAESPPKDKQVIDIQSSDDDEDMEMEDVMPVDSEVRMGDLADKVRAEPPQGSPPAAGAPQSEVDHGEESVIREGEASEPTQQEIADAVEEFYDWSESDTEQREKGQSKGRGEHETTSEPAGGEVEPPRSMSSSPEFEMVTGMETDLDRTRPSPPLADQNEGPVPMSGLANQEISDDQPDDESIYSDPEDEELFRQLAVEAEEHARFASTLNNKSQEANAIDYERELKALRNQQKKDRRDADEVTQTMISECQQLLSLFGLPYITAPMEAEAQCAELVHLGLVDGIVTDDSDIFLFGGTRVYKNMFNQAKFVECYLAQDLEQEFSLTRDRLIAIAQLLGSDYTEGIGGVGPVTALEILSEFGELESFRDWWKDVQSGTRPKEADATVPFRRRFRKTNATKLFLPPSWPDPRVAEAYLKPEVDADATAFAWGVPDLDALRRFLMSTIGWSSERTDEVLVPVIRDMNNREREGTQSNITAFLAEGSRVGAGAWAPRKRDGGSGRLVNALKGIGARARGERGDATTGGADAGERDGAADANEADAQKGKKKKRAKRKAVIEDDEDEDDVADGDGDATYEEEPRKKARKSGGAAKKGRGGGSARGRGPGKRALNNSEFILDASD